MTDMSRKTFWSVIESVRWANRYGITKFWMLRMDSDDLLDRDHVEFLNNLDTKKVRAVFNRKCHMFDPTTGEIAEHRYPYSTTCNALFMEIDKSGVVHPDWYYHCRNHTTFYGDVKKDKIPALETDWTLCILTNTGNSISGRPPLREEKRIQIIKRSKELDLKYGLGALDGFASV